MTEEKRGPGRPTVLKDKALKNITLEKRHVTFLNDQGVSLSKAIRDLVDNEIERQK